MTWRAWATLRSNGSPCPDPEDRQFVREALAQAKPAGVEISSDRFFLPWELLYDPYRPGGVSFSHFAGA